MLPSCGFSWELPGCTLAGPTGYSGSPVLGSVILLLTTPTLLWHMLPFGVTTSHMEEADRLLQNKHISTCSVPLHPFWHCLCRDWEWRCYHFKPLSGMRTKGKMKFLPYKWGCDDSGTKWSWWCFLVSLHTVTVNFMKLKSLVRQIFPCGSVGAIPWCSKTHEMTHISSRMPFLLFPLVHLWTGPLETVWAKFSGKYSPWDLFSKVKYQGTEWWTPKVWTTRD